MIRLLSRRLFFFCIISFSCIFWGSLSTPAAETPSPAKTYHEAIREAENDLQHLETDKETTGGWKLSEYLGLAALLVAIALTFFASRWTRRLFFRQAPGREMRVLDRMAVGKNSSLLLVQLRGRVYWLADHPGGITKLEDWPAETPLTNTQSAPATLPDKET